MHTGKKIKLLRNLKGISQEQLASKIGRTRGLISYIEQSGQVNHETLLLILNYFHLKKEEFDNLEQNQIKLTKTKENTTQTDELQKLKEQVNNYQKENIILKDLVDSQKEIIKLLKEKKR